MRVHKNVLYAVQSYKDAEPRPMHLTSCHRPIDTYNAIFVHTMSAALRGAITVSMNKPDADPKAGKGDNILIR